MSTTHGRAHLVNRALWTNRFEPPFTHFLAAAFLSDRRIGCVRAKKCPGAEQPETALTVLTDVARAGRKHGVRHAIQVRLRNENDDLALAGSATPSQWADFGQPQATRQGVVDAVSRVVERGVWAV